MVDFALPGLLGSPSAFNQVFGSAISRARDRDASQVKMELCCSAPGTHGARWCVWTRRPQ